MDRIVVNQMDDPRIRLNVYRECGEVQWECSITNALVIEGMDLRKSTVNSMLIC